MAPAKISIIEDNKVIRDNVSKFISFHEEFEITMAHASVESFFRALDIDPRLTTDIILLDMILPRLNGFEVLEQLRADAKFKTIPVLVLSNLGQDQDMEQAKQLGATDYIVKSNFSLQKVVEKISSILTSKA